DKGNLAISRADDEIVIYGRHAFGIAVEINAPDGQNQTDPEQRLPQPAQNERNHEKARDKRIAFAVDRHKSITDSVRQAHRSSFEFRRFYPIPPEIKNGFAIYSRLSDGVIFSVFILPPACRG